MKPVWFSRILLLLAVLSLGTVGCNKDDDKTTPEEIIQGGKGGNAYLNVIPQQNLEDIDSCWIYIKYNTLDVPASYDDSVLVVKFPKDRPTGTFGQLKRGNYYIYGKGWNIYNSEIVGGGIPYTISSATVDATIELPLYTIQKLGTK